MAVAVITGGASGIGQATAEVFARNGWDVVIGDYNEEAAVDAASDIMRNGHKAIGARVDVSDENSVARFFDDIDKSLGAPDALITSAGITFGARLAELSIDQWRRAIDVNLTGTFLCAQQAARRMVSRGKGAIITIASISAVSGTATRCAYAAAKGGVVSLTKTMAVELGQSNVRVNCIVPGNIETPMTRQHHAGVGAGIGAAYLARTPLGRYGQPGEVASAALYLASDDASYINGELLHVDGGYTSTGMMF
ncbi:SDR family NAD(P)-dependent oxidoreductase [Brucella pseudogrignonensis]|uniref:SDR family NAD(P)-dependent oxidoreductase n=1 Tax=Brucella pseudogrignonensis TaxID=419475 RepID=UPI003ECE6BC8